MSAVRCGGTVGTTPGGRLVFHVFGALASFELELVRERTMAGLAAARARGRTGGRPSVMTPSKLKQATRMANDGLPVTEIAQVLGMSRSTLYRHIEGVGTSANGIRIAALTRKGAPGKITDTGLQGTIAYRAATGST